MTGDSRRYVVFLAMSLLYFLLMAGTFNSLGLVLPAMVEEFHMSWAQAGFGFTLLGTACGIVSLVPAWLIRKIGTSLTLLVGTALLALGFGVLFAAHGAMAYYLGTILLGLGFCFCGTVPGVHVLSESFTKRSTALGTYYTSGSLGAVAGPVLYYAAQAENMGWRSYWLMFAFVSAVIGIFGALVTRGLDKPVASTGAETVAQAKPGGTWRIGWALRNPAFWVIVFAYTACLAINTTTHSFAYQHLLENGISAKLATQLISLGALIAAAGSTFAGIIGERLAPRTMVLIALGGLGTSAGVLALGQSGPLLAIWVVAMGVGLAFSFVSTALMLQQYFGHRGSLELYSIMTAVSTSAALGPLLGGWMRDQWSSFSGIFYALAGVNLVLFVAVLLIRRPQGDAQGSGEQEFELPVVPEIGQPMLAVEA